VIGPPPFLLALGLLFWGFHSRFEALAAALALALEAPRWLRVRWELAHRDFERVADLCTAAFAGALAFQFVQSRQLPDSLVCVLGWLPMLVHGPIPQKFNLLYIRGSIAVWAFYTARLLIGFIVGITRWPARWYLRGPLCGFITLFPLTLISLAMPGCGWP